MQFLRNLSKIIASLKRMTKRVKIEEVKTHLLRDFIISMKFLGKCKL